MCLACIDCLTTAAKEFWEREREEAAPSVLPWQWHVSEASEVSEESEDGRHVRRGRGKGEGLEKGGPA